MASSPTTGRRDVDAYLDAQPQPQRATLVRVREMLLTILPHGEECMKYSMPAIALQGTAVAGYAGFARHCGYYPMSGSVLEQAGEAVAGFTVSKGGLQFPVDRPLSVALVRRLVKLRLAELGSVENGKRTEYFDDGQVKATGSMQDGQLHGAWRWYRKDGSLMRTGSFSLGRKVGWWETWAADGVLATRVSQDGRGGAGRT